VARQSTLDPLLAFALLAPIAALNVFLIYQQL